VDFVHQFPVAIVPKKDTFPPEQEFADGAKAADSDGELRGDGSPKGTGIWLSNGGLRFAPYRRM